MSNTLADPALGVESLFGPARQVCRNRLGVVVGEVLKARRYPGDGVGVGHGRSRSHR